MNWPIQDVFDKSGLLYTGGENGVHMARVDAVAVKIRALGYVVECGTWDNNYVIFSIRRQNGEYVYGSVEPPIAVASPSGGWSDEEVDRMWPLSGHKSLPQYLTNHIDELILGPGKTLAPDPGGASEFASDQQGVSGCGLPDWRNLGEFVNMFYLNGRMRSGYQTWHIEQLLRDRRVNTISNTLPPDIVKALLRSRHGGQVWEFMEPIEHDDTTLARRADICREVSVAGPAPLSTVCPCPEDDASDNSVDSRATADRSNATPPVTPLGDCADIKPDGSGSSSEEE